MTNILRPDVLIQNVSFQCIPNLVAIRTFQPRKVIWVCTHQCRSPLKHLQQMASSDVQEQEVWDVDPHNTEVFHNTLKEKFLTLSGHRPVLYHLTGGTKAMSLQGLYNLGIFRREHNVEVQGIVMDPVSQHFDIIYPRPLNNVYRCAELTLTDMITVHNNQWDNKHQHTKPSDCSKRRELWKTMHSAMPALKKVWKANDMRALHARPPSGRRRHFGYEGMLPKRLRECLHLLQDAEFLKDLSFPATNEVKYEQQHTDIIKILNGGWLEYWLGSVLHDSDITWNQSFVSAMIIEGGGGKQEFDFLGATGRNRLVYWSCKTDAKLGNDKLFEVDALRDGIAGSDFHVAGLLHTAPMLPTMQAKAKRMHLHTVNAYDQDAEAKIIKISHG